MKKLFNKKFVMVLLVALVLAGAAIPIYGKLAASTTAKNQTKSTDVAKSSADNDVAVKANSDFNAADTTKNETVYAKLDPAGNVKDTTVVNWYHFNGDVPASIDDPVALSNDKALNGKFIVKKTDTGVKISSLDADMKDIYYSGQTQKGLPVKIKIDYFLNGQAIEPKDLAGKSGDVKIVFNADNLTDSTSNLKYKDAGGKSAVAQKEIYTPLVTMISLDLPADKFSNVEAPDGLITVVGETMKVNWMLFPYPSSSVALTMHAEDFALASASIIVQPKMPPLQDLNMEDKLVAMNDGITQMDQALGKVEDGSTQLSSGQSSILDGINKIKDGLGQLITLNQAEEKVAQGALTVNTMLVAGLQPYVDNPVVGDKLKPVIEALNKQKDLLTTLIQGGEINGQTLPAMSVGSSGLQQAQGGLDKLSAGVQISKAGAASLHDGVAQIREQGIGKMQSGVADSLNELRIGQAQIDLMKEKVESFDSFMGKPQNVSSRVQFVIQTDEIK
jgi:putative membrane protein